MKFQYRKFNKKNKIKRVFSNKRWQLCQLYSYKTELNPKRSVSINGYITLECNGILFMEMGYVWDGASGALDTKNVRRASVVHDALCQLIEAKKLTLKDRKYIDEVYRDICLEDGMSKLRANIQFWFIRKYVQYRYGKDW